MQNIADQTRSYLTLIKRAIVFFSFMFFLTLILWSPALWAAPEKEKQGKKPAPAPSAAAGTSIKSSAINDSNINAALKRADEMMKKGDVDGPLKILISVYEYSKDVLYTVKFFQGHYEKVANDPTTPQGEKEEIYIKLKRMGQLTPKYNSIKEVTTYNVGYLYAKKGDAEKARKYLTEVLELTPFSTKKDSISMKAKTLLLDLYSLEGEF
jgi:tetratricopeptide (TPR) repeat protein